MKANEINYGGVTFEDYQNAADTVCKYLDGLTVTHQIHDKLTEEAMKALIFDSIMASLPLIGISRARERFTEEAMKALIFDSIMASLPLIGISRARERFTEQLEAQMIRDGHMPKPEDNTEATEENL